jgi:hypothetical protein
MHGLAFTAERSLRPTARNYRTGQVGGHALGRRIGPADDVVAYKLCHDGSLRPCSPIPCDAGICWDCLHVCPEDPPALIMRRY